MTEATETRGGDAGGRVRQALVIGLLLVLPALAYAPAVQEERLLAPGDGTYLHYPLRVEAWQALRRGDVPAWNPSIFGGAPLLAGYRAGAFFPLMAALATTRPFVAFQWLVLLSLAAAGALTFAYLRRLGASPVGAYVGGLGFALGPYLVNHLGDTATVVAVPMLPLLLLAAESYARGGGARRAASVSLALALLLLAGSPEAARAGLLLLVGRLVLLHARARPGTPRLHTSLLTLAAGFFLAAPQLLPTLYAWREAGEGGTSVASSAARVLPGAFGVVLRYVSHTPGPALALIALPLVVSRPVVRALLAVLLLSAALRYGRGPLAAPGALSLVFDLALALLAGLSLGALWDARREAGGKRLRSYLLFGGLASALALSAAAAATGPLPARLAAAVGLLALSFILLVALYPSPHDLRAGLFLLPLTASFLLQPHGREAWAGAATRRELFLGTPAREAVDQALGPRRGERLLTLVRSWPRDALDLGFGNLAGVIGRSSGSGYDPLVPWRTRQAFPPGLSAAGLLPGAFFRTSPARLERLGVRFVQTPAEALVGAADPRGLGEPVDLPLVAGRPRSLPLPSRFATEVRLSTWMAEAVGMPQGEVVAWVFVRLSSGRELRFPLRAGLETAEWAIDRADVRPQVLHQKPTVAESFTPPGEAFQGHRYLAILELGGRYRVQGVRLERRPGPGQLLLGRVGLADGNRTTGVSVVSAYLSDAALLRELPAGPMIRLFAVRGSVGPARVVDEARLFDRDEDVRRALGVEAGFDPRREVLLTAAEARRGGLNETMAAARAGRAEVVRAEGSRLEVRAYGPGLLVLAMSFDPGWRARVDRAPAPVLRVNDMQMGVPLGAGPHRVTLRHRPRGLGAGLVAAALAALGLALAVVREGRSPRARI